MVQICWGFFFGGGGDGVGLIDVDGALYYQ